MLTGDVRSQIDRIWDAVWAGGITTPLNVIEQLTYLLFIRRLDDIHTVRENLVNMKRQRGHDVLFDDAIFPDGDFQPDDRSQVTYSYQNLRWSRFKDLEAGQMYDTIANGVFPFIKTQLSDTDSAFTRHMAGAQFRFPEDNPAIINGIRKKWSGLLRRANSMS